MASGHGGATPGCPSRLVTTAAQEPTIGLPDPSLVLLIGVTGAGKSTFAARHFRPTQVLSSDAFRALVADDATDQGATTDAFELLHRVVDRRLGRRRLTVIDATNLLPSARHPLLDAARRHGVPAVAIVFDLQPGVSAARNATRAGRTVPDAVHQRQVRALRRCLPELPGEGFAAIWLLRTPEAIDRTIVGTVGA